MMGISGAGQIVQWALGSNSKKMMDDAEFPVLYVPFEATFSYVKLIAFTTDLSIDDLEPLQYICRMAKILDAAIIVYHITSFERQKMEEEEGAGIAFFNQVISKITYDKIKFENIWHADLHEGFKWIRNNKEIDMIAMVHRQHTLLDKLVNGSYVQRLSRYTKIPLLIFQPNEKIYR